MKALFRNPYLWAFLIGITMLTVMRPFLRHVPPPPPVVGHLPGFSLTDATGRPFGNDDLSGAVHVVSFVSTRCTTDCPRSTAALGRLQALYDERGIAGVRLISITVDPRHDTRERMAAYGEAHGADPRRWSLLTGDEETIERLTGGLEDVAHTGKLTLVDGTGGIRGYYGTDEPGLDEVFHRSRHVLDEQLRDGPALLE